MPMCLGSLTSSCYEVWHTYLAVVDGLIRSFVFVALLGGAVTVLKSFSSSRSATAESSRATSIIIGAAIGLQ